MTGRGLFGECIGPPGAIVHHERCPRIRHGVECTCPCHEEDECPT